MLCFDIDDEEIVRRLSGRTVCEKCQTPYTGREPGDTCDKCGGTLVRRKDDEPDASATGWRCTSAQTAPVLEWYREHGTRVAVDRRGGIGAGRDVPRAGRADSCDASRT